MYDVIKNADTYGLNRVFLSSREFVNTIEELKSNVEFLKLYDLVDLKTVPRKRDDQVYVIHLNDDTGHPLTIVDHALVGLQHVVVFVAVFVHIRQRDSAELGRKAAVGEVDAAAGAVVDV